MNILIKIYDGHRSLFAPDDETIFLAFRSQVTGPDKLNDLVQYSNYTLSHLYWHYWNIPDDIQKIQQAWHSSHICDCRIKKIFLFVSAGTWTI